MNVFSKATAATVSMVLLSGCGIGTTALPEIWDRASDPSALLHMELQIKHAVYCQLRYGVLDARGLRQEQRIEKNQGQVRDITTVEDIYLPDSWGVLVQLSLEAEERSAVTPSVALKEPIDGAATGFRVGPPFISQSYQLGVGGSLSSQNKRYDKYNFYYAVRDLSLELAKGSVCLSPPKLLGDSPTRSSPLVNGDALGIREWLLAATQVISYRRSSRASLSGTGEPLGAKTGQYQSDAATYSNKFTVVSSANLGPSWNLIKIGTPTTPLLDLSRTRVHELIMTIGPGALPVSKRPFRGEVAQGPSQGVINAQLAAQIGSAVAAAIR